MRAKQSIATTGADLAVARKMTAKQCVAEHRKHHQFVGARARSSLIGIWALWALMSLAASAPCVGTGRWKVGRGATEDAQSPGHSLLGYYALGARLIACASYNWKIRVLCSEETFSNQPPLHLRQAFVCDDVIIEYHSFGLGERK